MKFTDPGAVFFANQILFLLGGNFKRHKFQLGIKNPGIVFFQDNLNSEKFIPDDSSFKLDVTMSYL